jgi:uncharacterized protein YndB with AHSA1/START domain
VVTNPAAGALSIRRRATISGAPDAVFDALVDDALVEEWMTAEAEIEPELGGAVSIKADGWIEMNGAIVVFDPPERLGLHWDTPVGALETDIRLAAGPSGTVLTLLESGFTRIEDVHVRDDLWSHWLIRLSAAIAVRDF